MSEPAPVRRTLIEQAQQMARDGYGVDDLVVKLQISRELARWFVLKKTDQKKR